MTGSAANSPSRRKLAVHVLNAGFGESIVLELPDGSWGVVDCYTSSEQSPETNPTFAFLRHRYVEALDFVCLTHPHSDHYRGLRHLLEGFRVGWFWQSAAVSAKQLLTYLKTNSAETGTQDSLVTLLHLVRHHSRERDLRVERLSGIQHLRSLDVDGVALDVHSIAPSGRHIDRYQEDLGRCLDENGRIRVTLPQQRHNEVSAALVVRYGETRVILGGDVEAAGWMDTLEAPTCPALSATAVKVSHHGSETGYCSGLWRTFASDAPPVAVVTPSRPHRLPKAEGLREIAGHSMRVLATSIDAVPEEFRPTGVQLAPEPPEPASVLRTFVPSFRALGRGDLGICTLALDHQGQCEVTTEGAAGELCFVPLT